MLIVRFSMSGSSTSSSEIAGWNLRERMESSVRECSFNHFVQIASISLPFSSILAVSATCLAVSAIGLAAIGCRISKDSRWEAPKEWQKLAKFVLYLLQ